MTLPGLAPSEPAGAAGVFGDALPLARRYAESLAGEGIRRGLIGPGEAGRLWDRHLLNCAVVTEFLPPGARVVDVGSGAGLPGLPMAICRPDLRVDLVEPMARRAAFLTEVLADLGLAARVRVFRGRADDPAVLARVAPADWAVARAVAPLDRLVRWCLPLLTPAGSLLALKGESAEAETARHRQALRRAGAQVSRIELAGADVLPTPTRVVVVTRTPDSRQPRPGRRT